MHSLNLLDKIMIAREFGIPWLVCRGLYAAKMWSLKQIPAIENLFEKHVSVKRVLAIPLNTEKLEEFLSKLPQEKKKLIIKIAENALQGRILGFSSIVLDYGYPIQWDKNPLTRYTTGMGKKWFEIPDFDPIRGDIKVIWEASRFTHFYYLTRAYMITKDRKYYKGFSNQLDQWLMYNPYGYGPNYKCGQECALRMINGLMAYAVFDLYGLVSDKDTWNIKELVSRCYKKILSNFFYAHKCIRNNHTLSELCGIIVGAWCCQDAKQLKKAYRWMNQEVKRQFLPDGGYRQYSFTYQRFALQLMELLMKIAQITGYNLDSEGQKLALKSAKMLFRVQNEQGDVPNYGSNDGALIFPVFAGSYRDFRPVVGGIFNYLEGGSPYPEGDYDEEILWFSNIDKPIKRIEMERKNSRYPVSGYYIVRDGSMMVAVIAQKLTSRPGQMDQLHVDMWVDDINILCDTGTYSYADNLGKELSLTGAHNTVKVENKEQMRKKGAFFIYGWPLTTVLATNGNMVSAYMRSVNGYAHQRSVDYKEGILIIHDQIRGSKDYSAIFHTPCEVETKGNVIYLIWNGKILAEVTGDYGRIEVLSCVRSLFYMRKEEIRKIILYPQKPGTDINTRIKLKRGDNHG